MKATQKPDESIAAFAGRLESLSSSYAGDNKVKVVLLGEGNVGKTSIFLRFFKKDLSESKGQTVQVGWDSKVITLPSGKRINMVLWDTAGQERFHSLAHIYYRDAAAAILVYDITDFNSFIRVQNWVKELRKVIGEEIMLFIVGNKLDLENRRVVNEQEVLQYSSSIGAIHYYTSAKLDKGINELFIDISKKIAESFQSVDDGLIKENKISTNDGCC